MSAFAISKNRTEGKGESSDDIPPDLDESKLEQIMEEMAAEGEGAAEDDPRQMARLMRKLHETAGMPLEPAMEEAIRRMEAGEDPDKIEEELGDLLDGGEGTGGESDREGHIRNIVHRLRPPKVDETIYDM